MIPGGDPSPPREHLNTVIEETLRLPTSWTDRMFPDGFAARQYYIGIRYSVQKRGEDEKKWKNAIGLTERHASTLKSVGGGSGGGGGGDRQSLYAAAAVCLRW